MDTELLAILACPKCLGELVVTGAPDNSSQDNSPRENSAGLACQGLACAACAVVYPVTDGIPALLVEEAVPQAAWERRGA